MKKPILISGFIFHVSFLLSQNFNSNQNIDNVLVNINPQQQFTNNIAENNLNQSSGNIFEHNQTAQILNNPVINKNDNINLTGSDNSITSRNVNQVNVSIGSSGGSKQKSKSGFSKWIYQLKKSFQKHTLKRRIKKPHTSKCGSWKGKI